MSFLWAVTSIAILQAKFEDTHICISKGEKTIWWSDKFIDDNEEWCSYPYTWEMYKSGIKLLYSAHLHYWNLAGPAPRLPSLTILSSLIPTGPSWPPPWHLSLQLHGQAHLVATLVEVLAINKGGECKSDAIPNLLLIAQTHLSRIVNLGPQSCILV